MNREEVTLLNLQTKVISALASVSSLDVTTARTWNAYTCIKLSFINNSLNILCSTRNYTRSVVCNVKGFSKVFRTISIFFPDLESNDQDFVVKFKGQFISWKNISQLLRQHNITVPHEGVLLRAVLQQKDYSPQSCEGRCFLEERREEKPCYCDKACKTFSDCCLDFYARYDPAQFHLVVFTFYHLFVFTF